MVCMKRAGLAIWMVTLAMIIPSGVMADDFKLTPSLGVSGEYHDNIFYSSDNTEDDFITTFHVGLELTESTEWMDLKLAGIVSPFFYADNSDLG